MIAGRGLVAPRRWSFPAVATTARISGACRLMAWMKAAQKTRNWALSWGLSPGSSRFPCLALVQRIVHMFAEPLMPEKGFSCNRHDMPYFSATRLRVKA